MAETFKYDVFLSHSSKDKPAVRALAERLKADGLRVWFDEWEIKPGDSIPLKIEQGLEQSRTLVLVMSAAAFASEWVTLERHTVLFRDPTNAHRRFVPLRLDDGKIKEALRQFAYVDWRGRSDERYAQLLEACRAPAVPPGPLMEQEEELSSSKVLRGHTGAIGWVAIALDGRRGLSASWDRSMRVWDLDSGECIVEGSTRAVYGVSMTLDGRRGLPQSTGP